jgi:hypothetical protein
VLRSVPFLWLTSTKTADQVSTATKALKKVVANKAETQDSISDRSSPEEQKLMNRLRQFVLVVPLQSPLPDD